MKTFSLNRILPMAAVVAACASPAEPGPGLLPGIISFYGDPVVIEVPQLVQADTPFDVSVRTYGGGCVTKDGTEVDVGALRADVRPMDRHSGDQVCTMELRMFEHTASITFHEKGEARVFFHGTTKPGDSAAVFVRVVRVE